MQLECFPLLDVRNELGEGPVWNHAEGTLYWIDCIARELLRYDPSDAGVKTWSLDKQPGAFTFRRSGGILVVYRNGLAFLDLESGETTPLNTAPVDFAKERFNDGKCDRLGRFWTGTMDRGVASPVGSLYRIDTDLRISHSHNAITLSNGIAWSPDARVMYHCDSRPGMVLRYDFDLESGTVGNRRPFIDYSDARGQGRGRPDGCTVDAEGCLWVAELGAGRVGRYDPDGKLVDVVTVPADRPTSVMFGGAQLDTLFITSMRYGVPPERLAEQPLCGAVFTVQPGVRGLAEPWFAG